MNNKDRIEGQLKLLEIAGKRIERLESESERLREALVGVVDMYCCLINSGDAGNWNPEEDDEIIAARKALSQGGE